MSTIEASPGQLPNMPEGAQPEGSQIERLALEGAKAILDDSRFKELPRARQAEIARGRAEEVRGWFPDANVRAKDFLPEGRQH